jgi:hypothetical protein
MWSVLDVRITSATYDETVWRHDCYDALTLQGVTLVGRAGLWIVAGLVTAVVFAVATWVSGQRPALAPAMPPRPSPGRRHRRRVLGTFRLARGGAEPPHVRSPP